MRFGKVDRFIALCEHDVSARLRASGGVGCKLKNDANSQLHFRRRRTTNLFVVKCGFAIADEVAHSSPQ
jgi:hypothetical protein